METDLNYISSLLEDFENIVEKSSSKEDQKVIYNELRDLQNHLLGLRDRMWNFEKWSQNDLTDNQYAKLISIRLKELQDDKIQ